VNAVGQVRDAVFALCNLSFGFILDNKIDRVVIRQAEPLSSTMQVAQHIPDMIRRTPCLAFVEQRVLRVLENLKKRRIKLKPLAIEIKLDIDVLALVHLNQLLDVELHVVLLFVAAEHDCFVRCNLLHRVLLLEFRDFLLQKLLILVLGRRFVNVGGFGYFPGDDGD
jgi:hypothetical protein